MATRFIPNPLGIALIARTPFMANAMLERADAVAETAKEIAPEGPGRDGHYRDMIDTAPIVALGVAGGRVNAWKFTAVFLEFGTSDTPTFATLRTSCDANGLALTGGRQS